ncbi:MAG: biotin/lipoyl-containing protein [Saprospiraceae bacterium]|nr:biotin/lipoyl-containing protein [Saprospiraceae bacterium]
MTRDIKLCLVYRDMWQSSGKYMPRKDQLVKVAEPIIEMGCFSRVETNGGGFEQINLLMGENPNDNVRAWTAPLRRAGIQTQMLERGLNGIRMSPCPTDVRRLMFKVKKQQGTDIARSFDGLNNPQNLEHSFAYAREAGMIAQAALCITHSPIHTVEYYLRLADDYIELGAEEICIKDMAGIGRPASIGRIVKGIKARHPEMLVQYHGHSTPGFSVASSLEAARAGADIIDVGIEPLSWGTGHADLLTIHAMLDDAGFRVPAINIDAYMHARQLTQEFIDDFLGFYINPRNRFMNSILIAPGLPGGMMGSLMADLEQNLQSINKWLEKRGKEKISQDRLLLMLFKEVEYVWPQLGYPPLVTPFSQYVKNVALMNVLQMIKGRGRWTMIDENTWGMILGRSGQLPGKLGIDIIELAKEQGREFYKGVPQDLYPDELELFAMKMDEQGWAYGPDDEELFEYAMHPTQYEDFKSGRAKEQFISDLKERIAQRDQPAEVLEVREERKPRSFVVEVDGEKFAVKVAYDDDEPPSEDSQVISANGVPGAMIPITAPLEGKFFLTKETGERGIEIGDEVRPGDTVAYIESMKVINAITSEESGRVAEIVVKHGDAVEEDDVLIRLAPI